MYEPFCSFSIEIVVGQVEISEKFGLSRASLRELIVAGQGQN